MQSEVSGRRVPLWETCKRLLPCARPYRVAWLLVGALTLLSSAVALLQPWPMKIVVDNVLGGQLAPAWLMQGRFFIPGIGSARGMLAWAVTGGLALFLLASVVEVLLTRTWIRTGQRMVYDLAGDLFGHIVRRSLLFHSRNPVGDSMSRVTGDVWCVYTVVDTLLITPLHALITMIVVLSMMARMDIGLALLSVAVAPFMAGSSLLLGRHVRAVAHARREIESRIQSHVQQTLSLMPIVQAFVQEERQDRRFQEFASAAIQTQRKGVVIGGVNGLTSGLIISVGSALILWLGGRHVLSGQLTVGALLVFLAYLNTLQLQMKACAGIYGSLQQVGANSDRVLEILDAPQEVADRADAVALPAVQGHVRFEHVTFGYEPERPILRDVSLEARPGQTIAIVGATGAGKSTLMGLIPRFFDPWEGRVTLDGHDLRDLPLKSLREQVALVLQEPFLFPISLAENIAYGRPEATQEQIEAAARAANVHAFITAAPHGYETVIGERGATLSGGERQRVSIARALLKDAPILILDEPTSALDAQTESSLLEALERLMAGRTTFIIAHRLSTIRRADMIVVMDEGRVAEVGTHRQLLAREGLYDNLYRKQFQEQPNKPVVGVT